MKILLFTTGGTIGSSFDGDRINVRADGKSAVVDRYQAEHGDVQLDIKCPLNILSERVSCGDLNILAQALLEAELSRYDGVIVTAGSDTLAYLAGFVGLLLGGCPIPVMIVAANKILTAPDSNGYENFCCAAELIRQGVGGVYVPYRNSGGTMYVHSATELRQAELSEDFFSLHGAYGVFENGVLREQRPYIAQHIPAVFGKERLPRISDSVLLLHPYPMQDYARISAHGVRAVLHTLYHSATLDSGAAADFIRSLGDVPFFIASIRAGQKPYATTKEIIEAGAVPLYDISPECAYMKLLLACAQDELSIREFMEDNQPSP
ncbi:MAG: asparaginase [Ruminococcus sp.]|nr:asparaginase [Ruminococcus sp.]